MTKGPGCFDLSCRSGLGVQGVPPLRGPGQAKRHRKHQIDQRSLL